MATTAPDVAPTGEYHLQRKVGLRGMTFVSLGSIIGSGWLFGALGAATPSRRRRLAADLDHRRDRARTARARARRAWLDVPGIRRHRAVPVHGLRRTWRLRRRLDGVDPGGDDRADRGRGIAESPRGQVPDWLPRVHHHRDADPGRSSLGPALHGVLHDRQHPGREVAGRDEQHRDDLEAADPDHDHLRAAVHLVPQR